MMMNDLLQIQNEMRPPEGAVHPRHDEDELQDNEADDAQYGWLEVPVTYSPYHRGYTTKHWLSVFCADEKIV